MAVEDGAVFANDEDGALDTEDGDTNVVELAHGLVGVGEEWEWQTQLVAILVVRVEAVCANRCNLQSCGLDFWVGVTRPCELVSSAGGVIFGVEDKKQGGFLKGLAQSKTAMGPWQEEIRG